MTPDEFRQRILPALLAAWESDCFCQSPGFRKLLSFNFEDYGIGPVALADSEILIQEIVRDRFTRDGEPKEETMGTILQTYRCPRCSARCTESYAEYSINMYRSFVLFDDGPEKSAAGIFLVGFYGFKQADFEKIHDFRPAADDAKFIAAIAGSPSEDR